MDDIIDQRQQTVRIFMNLPCKMYNILFPGNTSLDQFRIPGNRSQRCFQLMGYIRRKFLPELCTLFQLMMLSVDLVKERLQLHISLFRFVLTVQMGCQLFDRFHNLTSQKSCHQNTDKDHNTYHSHQKRQYIAQKFPDTVRLFCNADNTPVRQLFCIIKCTF